VWARSPGDSFFFQITTEINTLTKKSTRLTEARVIDMMCSSPEKRRGSGMGRGFFVL
jgi:hypothetical protein